MPAMRIGAMNDPSAELRGELEWIASNGFDYVDLTVEPERCMPEQIEVRAVRRWLGVQRLGIVGHVGDWRLPKDSGYESLRRASRREMVRAMRLLARLGAGKVTIHAPEARRLRDVDRVYPRHRDLIASLLDEAAHLGVGLMLENGRVSRANVRLLDELLAAFPALGLHLDVGHANLGARSNQTATILRKHGRRLCHVHLSDNRGEHDDHRQLGWGNIDWPRSVRLLRRHGYDGTITLEVFSSGDRGLLLSRRRLREWWTLPIPRIG
jgi:sugar phosphate isomerase/epimerase